MKDLYTNLLNLANSSDASKFFFRDAKTPFGTSVRIFGYNYASYSDWLLPDALESRGIMFEMNGEEPVRIMSRPMEKFFNLDENPLTMNLDLSTIVNVMDKADGSLISTFIDNGVLFTKSKASIFSDQATAANQLLLDIDYADLRERATELAKEGFTLNFEYVSPGNRIVLAYEKPDLILLNVRHNDSGEYVPYQELVRDTVLRKYLVKQVDVDLSLPPEELISNIRGMYGIEGYVFVLEDGTKFKLKTDWYSMLHRTKDTLNNNKDLFEVIVWNQIDDIRSLFDDEASLNKIKKFEEVFLKYLSESLSTIDELRKELAGADRKQYAITAQTKLKNSDQFYLFGTMMQLFEAKIDNEYLVDALGEVFIKNVDRFIPEEYKGVQNWSS